MKLVVVGGVAGGMSAAARARRLDETAEIVVLERGEHVSFANCGLPYYVGGEITDRDDLLVQTPDSLRAALDLDVRTRHDVVGLDAQAKTLLVDTPAGRRSIDYDALVLSPGAAAVRPNLPGIDSPRVSTLRTVDDAIRMRDNVEAGASRAVVLGAGFIGVEAAEALSLRGLDVTLVELAHHVLPVVEPELAALATDELGRLGIDVRTGVAATAIEHRAEHDVVHLSDGTTVEADLVLLSVGVRPDTAVFEQAGVACERGAIITDERGRTNLDGVYAVGDATISRDAISGERRPVALAGPANRAGRLVAEHILRPESARPIPRPLATSIVRVGELTVATTGATRQALRRDGRAFHTLHLHPNQHAGYFPGASRLHLVVQVGEDGSLLGAQGVGPDGVDKRIDVLATAMRGGLHAADLIDLDLAYAPPYGSAKDPVNLVGMMAENVLNGTTRLWYADELEDLQDTALVLDVRSASEFDRGHVPGALNIPHTELRDRIDEVRDAAAGRPVRAYCASGMRSYIAHRVLAAAGLDSATLSGGILTLRAVLGREAVTPLRVPEPAGT
ncbi:MAG TPA: FAD-dependent oxidoreductase [Ornithinicoccus sp.]|nr:FAD-dependent oxidoreductase [Ornithinicoccus sp.]